MVTKVCIVSEQTSFVLVLVMCLQCVFRTDQSPVSMSIILWSCSSWFNVTVTNTAWQDGWSYTSVLAYVTSNVRQQIDRAMTHSCTHSHSQVPGAPIKQLFDFQKVFLTPGQSVTILFTATPDTCAVVTVVCNNYRS